LNRGFNSSLNDDTVVTCKVEIAGSSAITLVGRRLGERRREVAQVGKQQSGAGGRRAGSSFRRGWGVGRGPRLGNGAASDGGGEVRGRPATARRILRPSGEAARAFVQAGLGNPMLVWLSGEEKPGYQIRKRNFRVHGGSLPSLPCPLCLFGNQKRKLQEQTRG
jgi:hypothetical protein